MKDIFITRIEIKQLRHLQDVVIELDSNERKHLVITGKNGSGKTSLLDAIRDQGLQLKEDSQVSVKYNQAKTLNKGYIFEHFGAKRDVEVLIPRGITKIMRQGRERFSIYFIQYLVNLRADSSFARSDGDHGNADKIDEWFKRFELQLRYIFEDDKLEFTFNRKEYNFYFKFGNGNVVDANNLPDGFASLFHIITEIIMLMNSQEQISSDLHGIVLIDEIEAHLHIDLQKKVLPFLSDFFPNIQFLITTHSPFVINSEASCVVYDLEKDIRIEDATGYSFDTIIESYFGSDKYSHEVTKKVKQYEGLALKAQLTPKEQVKHLQLKKYFDHVPLEFAPELKVKLQQIRLAQLNKKAG